MKKLLLVLVAIIAIVAVGCDSGGSGGNSEVKKAALLTSGPVNDGGWNMIAYDGLKKLEGDGWEIANTENVGQDSQKSTIADYAAQGYTLIIGHGYEFGDALVEAAEEYPDTKFVQIGGSVGGSSPNISSCEFRSTELGYYAGNVATALTQSKKVGFVGAEKIPTVTEEMNSYKATVAAIDPSIEFIELFTGSWTDVVAGKNAATQLINSGCDVIVGIGDACDAGVMQAIEESGKDVWMIGWSGDFNITTSGKDYIATSCVQDVAGAISLFGSEITDDKWDGRAAILGSVEGLQYLGKWSDKVPKDIVDKSEAEVKKVEDKELSKRDIFEFQKRPDSEYYKQSDEK